MLPIWQIIAAFTIFGFAGSFVVVYFVREETEPALFGDSRGQLFHAAGFAAIIIIMMITVVTQLPIGGLMFGFLVQSIWKLTKPQYFCGIRLRNY